MYVHGVWSLPVLVRVRVPMRVRVPALPAQIHGHA